MRTRFQESRRDVGSPRDVSRRGLPSDCPADETRGHVALAFARFWKTRSNHVEVLTRYCSNLKKPIAFPVHQGRIPGKHVQTRYTLGCAIEVPEHLQNRPGGGTGTQHFVLCSVPGPRLEHSKKCCIPARCVVATLLGAIVWPDCVGQRGNSDVAPRSAPTQVKVSFSP